MDVVNSTFKKCLYLIDGKTCERHNRMGRFSFLWHWSIANWELKETGQKLMSSDSTLKAWHPRVLLQLVLKRNSLHFSLREKVGEVKLRAFLHWNPTNTKHTKKEPAKNTVICTFKSGNSMKTGSIFAFPGMETENWGEVFIRKIYCFQSLSYYSKWKYEYLAYSWGCGPAKVDICFV